MVMLFRELIRAEMDRRGWKTAQFAAEKMDMHPEYLRQILKGTKQPPSDDIIVKMASVLWDADPDRGMKTASAVSMAASERAKTPEAKSVWEEVLTTLGGCSAMPHDVRSSPINPVELANCSLRHTFISHLLASGADIRAVMAAVGHTQLETTMRYLSMVRGLADVSLLKF